MKTILLTGASGLIGSHCIAPLIQRGYKVHAVATKLPQVQPEDSVVWHAADLLDESSIPQLLRRTQPSHLLHLAWYLESGKWSDSELNFSWVQASMTLLRNFREVGGKRVAVAGSSYEYDWTYGYCHETRTPLAHTSAYGTCKNALRVLVEEYASLHHISATWPRIFFTFGPRERQDRLVPSVILALLQRRVADCTHGRQIRDYLYVQDVADAIVSLVDSDVEGAVNIGSGQPISVSQIVTLIGDMLNGAELIRLGALPSRESDQPLVVSNVEKLTTKLAWQPKYPLKEGLALTIDWWRTRLDSAGER
jgi:nucleoside-diphosphate-sugar epimerase